MSLLFLSNILEGVTALDDSGDPLPFAVLTFWQAHTTTPQAVYQDQDASIPLSDSKGRVVADSRGVFTTIYLHTTRTYRVKLETADGVLRWDVDPYLCDCTDPPRVFRNPFNQTLTKISDNPPTFVAPSFMGSRIRLSAPGGDVPTISYADAERTIRHQNPVKASAAGVFPPIYLDDHVTYRVRLEDENGVVLLDLNPYECQCGFLILTSKLYPFEWLDATVSVGGALTRGLFSPVFLDATSGTGGVMLSGTMIDPVKPYNNWPVDASIGTGGAILSGTMVDVLKFYNNWPVDASIGTGGAMISGTMIAPLIFYDNWPVDATIGTGGAMLSGTLN